MGVPVLILGESGRGKTHSIKSFKSDEACIISVQKPLLPFRGKFDEFHHISDYQKIEDIMKATKKKVIVVDDLQYLMSNEYMRRAYETGYQKFTDIGYNFWNLVVNTISQLPADTIVYLMAHTDNVDGKEKMKTIGKLVDEKLTPEGLFTIVLKAVVQDGVYSFLTQNSGNDTVKSPEDMFPSFAIKNDLKYVDDAIRNYYYMDGAKTDDEMKAASEEQTVSAEKPTRRSRAEKARDAAEEQMAKRQRILDEKFPDQEEIPFDEACAAIEEAEAKEQEEKKADAPASTPAEAPVEEAPKRRTRRTRSAE